MAKSLRNDSVDYTDERRSRMHCPAESWLCLSRRPLLALLLGVFASGVVHAQSALRDVEDRLEYAYYAGDARALQRTLEELEQNDLLDLAVQRQMAVNYGRWKSAALLASTDAALAGKNAAACAEAGSAATATATQKAVNAALQAACSRLLEQLRPLRSALYKRQRERELEQANALGRLLPQVRMIQASMAERPDVAQWRQVVAAYDAAVLGDNGNTVSWGHAEACFQLGQAALAQQDMLAARNALERAVLLAPDYQAAQQLLRTLAVK